VSCLYYSFDDRRRQEFLNEQPDQRASKQANASAASSSSSGAAAANAAAEASRKATRKAAFSEMVRYCEEFVCRRAVLLKYFGEQPPVMQSLALEPI
jgi:superfamily II DNA helicase RecQ